MNEIAIPYQLAIPSLICIFFLLLIVLKRKKLLEKNNKAKWLWIGLIVFVSAFLIIVGGAASEALYHQWNLNGFDLNHDGLFSNDEVTEEQKVAVSKLTKDVGRNFALIIGLLFAFMLALPTFVIGQIIDLVTRKKPPL